MSNYHDAMEQVIRILGANGGYMDMRTIFYKIDESQKNIDGEELGYKLSRVYGYLIPYGETHSKHGVINKGEWILSAKGWQYYKDLIERDEIDIPF